MSSKLSFQIHHWQVDIEEIPFFVFSTRAIKAEFSYSNKKSSIIAHCRINESESTEFVSLTVEYKEPLHSIGKFYHQRRDKSSDRETIVARWIDRFLRPLIEKFNKEVLLFIDLIELSPLEDLYDLEFMCTVTAIILMKHIFPINICGFCDSNIMLAWNKDMEIISLFFSGKEKSQFIISKIKQVMKECKHFFSIISKIPSTYNSHEKYSLLNSWEEIHKSSIEWIKRESAQNLINGRIDKREKNEIRKMSFFPLKSNSVIFSRGKTSVASFVDCSIEKFIVGDSFTKMENIFSFYSFPFFATKDKNKRKSNRRELGHSYLIKKSFDSTIDENLSLRIVSQTYSADGSSSMAAVCATSSALFQMGIIDRPVAAISIGSFDGKTPVIDITADEDQYSFMDLKICGISNITTAIQMDTKCPITIKLFSLCLTEGKKAIKKIILQMKKEIKVKNSYKFFYLAKEKVKFVIGQGGTMKKSICDVTNSKIFIGEKQQVLLQSENMPLLLMFINFYGLQHYIKMPVAFFSTSDFNGDTIPTTIGNVKVNCSVSGQGNKYFSGIITNLSTLEVKLWKK